MRRLTFFTVAVLIAGITLTGCDEGSLDPGSNARLIVSFTGESGTIQKSVFDENGIEAVYLVISGADIKPADEMWRPLEVLLDTVDLVELAENGLTETLIDEDLAAGTYEQMRLYFEDSMIVVDGDTLDLFVPSGMQTGYKLVDEFELEPGVTYELHIDFDIDESIVKTENGLYMLKPTTRITVVTS